MNSKRIRNHDAHITYTLQLLSFVLCTLRSVPIARVCCANIQPSSKLLITMDLVSSVMIPSLTHSDINSIHFACFSFTIRVYALFVVCPASPGFSRCGKDDFHQLCCKPGQSRFPHSFHIKSWFKTYQIFPQASLSGNKSSHDHPFILRVFVTPGFSVALPYCDMPVVIIVTTSTHSYIESLCSTWGPHSEFLKSFSLIAQSFYYHPSDRSRLRISLSIFHMDMVSSFTTAHAEQTHATP
jgi:hypothetical protein